MNIRYHNLLSPLQIGDVLLKNRMVATAATPHMLQGMESWPTEKWTTHMANRAKNGAAAVYINHLYLDGGPGSPPGQSGGISLSFPGHDISIDLSSNASHAYMCQMIDAIRYYGSVALTQPMGQYTRTRPMPGGPDGPDGPGGPGGPAEQDPEQQLIQEQVQCMGRPVGDISKQQIQEYIDSTVESAKILKLFGFEMFSIHCAYHNCLAAEFWSEDTNNRTDEYGGSAKNRARLILELYDALRSELGSGFPLECLISPTGPGVNIPDTIELARLAEGKIDILHMRHGLKDPQHPVGFNSTREHPSPNTDGAAAIKRSILERGDSMLVAVSAGLQNPDYSEMLLREKKADIIAMARAWICDPEYGTKLYEGRGEDVRPCIRCNKCHVPNDSDKFRSFCSVNPTLGMEDKLDRMIAPVKRKKNVAVVGGGPAGMQAAITCSGRGHAVTLYEARPTLGGQLTHADYASFKWPLADFNHWLIRQLYKSGARIILNTTATKELLESEGYDDVIVAIGPKFQTPKIPGLDRAKAYMAFDVYGREKELPRNVVVIGGSETGTETGMYLAENGHNVTVMTRQNMLAADAAHAHYVVMLMEAYKSLEGFHYVRKLKKYLSVDETGVTYLDNDGNEQHVPADAIVIASGVKPVPELTRAFYGAASHTHYIGDCYRTGDVHKAVTAGFAVGNQI